MRPASAPRASARLAVAPRRRLGLGISLFLASTLASACSEPDETAAGEASSPVSSPARSGPRGGAVPAADLDLEAMLSPVPEYEGVGRNLFAYGAARRPTDVATDREPSVDPQPREIVTLPTRPTPRPGPSPSARLDMKYAGFLEKTGPDGDKAKYAIFLDGNEILAGMEGDMLANRFTVVEIGLESVTVSLSGSSATQRIPLQSK
ncbi:MAG TPA: hypothetical protein VJH87_17900 [Vicinamibacteria bacterium]|nr:hypothetical protein [Vicinamibacteria bacterium]